MGAGSFVEPLVVVTLLFGGTWVNRNRNYRLFAKRQTQVEKFYTDFDGETSRDDSDTALSTDNLLDSEDLRPSPSALGGLEPTWRRRTIGVLDLSGEVVSPNTRRFRGCLLSRLLLRFPFLVEAWYWALIYWLYQLGRAFTAVTLVDGTVHVARKHALQLIHLEEKLHIFWEPGIQQCLLRHPLVMTWINRIYSFIHIPGTILFLVWLYWDTTTRHRAEERQLGKGDAASSTAEHELYEARRRTMAFCNLLAFVVFTAWPCMPPRLLGDPNVRGPSGDEARSYGFVDTVHGRDGESSVWTQNRFCNQYAAMPSLHFGYALMIGVTIATIPLYSQASSPPYPHHHRSMRIPRTILRALRLLPSLKRLLCVALGAGYALTILVAIIATANHFILDAVAGAIVCVLGWWGNGVLLNLLPLEDYFLCCVRIHKPTPCAEEGKGGDNVRAFGEMTSSTRWRPPWSQ